MRSSIVFLVLACLATGSMASITSYPFCSTGTMPVNQFCASKCGSGGFTRTCTCSPSSQKSLCDPNSGKCEADNVCAVSSTFFMGSNLFGDLDDLNVVKSPQYTTMQQCACACKNDPQCQAFGWINSEVAWIGGGSGCYLGAFKTAQTPLTPCLLPADLNLNFYLGLTLGFKKTAINTSQVVRCNVPSLLMYMLNP